LKQDRNERLFVYTQSKSYAVNSNSFTPISHDEILGNALVIHQDEQNTNPMP